MRSRNRISRRIILVLSLGIFGTMALYQSERGSWIEPAAASTGLRGPAHIIDGDTLDINGSRIRIHGIDAPESKQTCQDRQGRTYACGADATQALIRWIGSQTVTCTRWADRASYAREAGHNQDRYGRIIATCSVGRADLGTFMVESGHALAYRRYSTAYIGVEVRAQSAGIGMWQGTFIAPWHWRRGQR